MAILGRKVGSTISKIKHGAEMAGKIASTVGQVADAAQSFHAGLN